MRKPVTACQARVTFLTQTPRRDLIKQLSHFIIGLHLSYFISLIESEPSPESLQ